MAEPALPPTAFPPSSTDAVVHDPDPLPVITRVRRLQHAAMILAVSAVIVLLVLARSVVVPLLFAVLIALALCPLVHRMNRRGVPAPVSAALVLGAFVALTAFGISAMSGPLSRFSQNAPQAVEAVRTEIGRWSRYLSNPRPVKLENVRVRAADKPKLDTDRMLAAAGVLLPRLRNAVIGIGVTLVLAYFMLLGGRPPLRTAIALIRKPASRRRALAWSEAVQRQLTHYLLAVTAINTGFGLVAGLLLATLGQPSAAFWGALAGLLNFLPFLGAILMTGLLAVAALGADSLSVPPLIVPLAFVGLHLIEAEFVTPFVLGKALTLNPLFMIVAVLVFGTAWGIGGAFLAVPLLIVAKVSFAVLPGVWGWSQVFGRRRYEVLHPRVRRRAQAADAAPASSARRVRRGVLDH